MRTCQKRAPWSCGPGREVGRQKDTMARNACRRSKGASMLAPTGQFPVKLNDWEREVIATENRPPFIL